ncbi:hypothetical protein [Halochromatium salexigens]|uniref:Uncharacterized protein n=1 Tax=Halochromatium salexigens TaxID=49447 RepID=A0AAJ0XFZ4_HALSE|nr:hypothetical protein [Halochromatium salexigens]MBK5930898.1 hypothetical protein [Halochromatium salexigens]
MSSSSVRFAEAAMRHLAGEDVALNEALQSIFARILSRQVTVDEANDSIDIADAFATLLPVFTFVASPPTAEDRPTAPMLYGERIDDAIDQARAELFGDETDPDPDQVAYHSLAQGVEQQTLSGTTGQQDVFVVPIREDDSGVFANIGEAVIQDYQQEDGDLILFVGQRNEWASFDEWAPISVRPQDGNATLRFDNNEQLSAPDQLQRLMIEGAETARPYSNAPTDITNVEMAFAAQASLEDAGGLEAYVTEWLL